MEPFVFERTFNAPSEKVWRAITDKDQMKEWYFDIAEFQPEVGYYFRFEGGDDRQKYLHLCTVTEVVPGRKLTYSWRYDGYLNETYVTFELSEEGDRTRLKLTHEGTRKNCRRRACFCKRKFCSRLDRNYWLFVEELFGK